MGLTGRRCAALLAGLVSQVAIGHAAHADGATTRASSEVAGYQDTTATSVLTPSVGVAVESPTAGWGVSGSYLVDVVSAASPDIISTASPRWREVRQGGGLGAKYKPGLIGVSANAGISYTPDYLALGGGAEITADVDDKNLTLLGGYSYGHDTIGKTGTKFSVFSHDLVYHSLRLGLSDVVNRGVVVGLYGDAVLENGDQSKPYRYIPLFSAAVAETIPRGASASSVAALRLPDKPGERLPLTRQRFAATGRLGWRRESSTLRVEERLYTDTWALHATTTDARYFIDLGSRVTLWPHARFHAQQAVSFWRRAYVSNGPDDVPAYRAGDRELGALTSVTGGGGLKIALGRAGALDDVSVTTTVDGTWTSFGDTLYIKNRFSGFAALGLEVVLR